MPNFASILHAGSHQPLGVSGWRVAFFVMACVSALTGLLNLVFTRDPRRHKSQQQVQQQQHQQEQQQQQEQALQAFGTSPRDKLDWGLLSREVLSVIKIPTFLIIVLQVWGGVALLQSLAKPPGVAVWGCLPRVLRRADRHLCCCLSS